VDREQHEQANRTLRQKLMERVEANRFVLMDDGRIQRAVAEAQPRSNETGEGEHED
jgi:hypothetical protein